MKKHQSTNQIPLLKKFESLILSPPIFRHCLKTSSQSKFVQIFRDQSKNFIRFSGAIHFSEHLLGKSIGLDAGGSFLKLEEGFKLFGMAKRLCFLQISFGKLAFFAGKTQMFNYQSGKIAWKFPIAGF